MRLPGFAGGTYQDQSRTAAGERCINMFPERIDRGGKVRLALYPTPGFTAFATLMDSPGRGVFAESERLFAVYGSTFYEIAADGTPTPLGQVDHDGSPVFMSTNGDGGQELFTVSAKKGYILDLVTNTLTHVVSDVTHGDQIDGFFVALDAETATLKISERLDGQTWDPTQIAQRTSASDLWRAMVVVQQEAVLIGEKTGEVWFNAGRSPFPFAKRPGAEFDVGIAARYAITKFAGSCAWLGQSAEGGLGVYRLNGYTPERISRPGLDWLLQQYAEEFGVSDARAWAYAREGHEFLVLHFPAASRTHVYDATTREWHERGKWNASQNAFGVYRALYHAHAFGRDLVCDPSTNKLHAFSSTTWTDVDGDVLRRVRVTPRGFHNENKRLFFPRIELECDRGVGLTPDGIPGSDPSVMLRYSNDGGHTWGAYRTRPIGKRGEYATRVVWLECGSGRDRVWEFVQTDPVPCRWYDAYVQVRAGRY